MTKRYPSSSRGRFGSAALVAGALVLASSAAVAAQSTTTTPSELSGNFSVTMDLETAVLQPFSLDDAQEEFVIFTFADEVQEIEDENGFYVAGYESDAFESATTVRIVEDQSRDVLVGFPSGTNLTEFSVVGVEAGIVRNVQGEINLPTTMGLEGSTPSLNARPELVDVTDLDQTLNRASFIFSSELDETSAEAAQFGYYTPSGIAHLADRVISTNNEVVILEWNDADTVEDAASFFVADGAVLDLQGFGNLIGSTGGSTAAPDLVSVDSVVAGLWNFEFDESVVPLAPGDYALYTQNGDRFSGDDFASVGTDTVGVVFRGVEDFVEQVTFAAVDTGAVRSITADGAENTIGSQPITSGGVNFYVGVTAGPDLIGVESETDEEIVTFTFDQNIENDALVDPDLFYLVTEAGEVVQSRAIVQVDGPRTVVLFDATRAQAAVAAGVLAGALVDENHNPNLDRSLPLGSGSGFSTDIVN